MVRFRYSVVLMAFAGVMMTAQAAPPWAEGNNEQKGKGASHSSEKKHSGRGDVFRDEHRSVVRDYYERNPSSLPPGLAKRGGNLPPGLAKGAVLPRDLEPHLLPLPRELELRLPPPPHEVIRRIIGRDLVLIHEQTHKVLDILHDALP